MKLPDWLRGLSIFSRSFLLVFAALVVAEGIGLALFVSRPPLHNEPVALSQLADALRVPADGPDSTRPHPPWSDSGPGPGPAPAPNGADHGPPRGPPGPPHGLRIEERAAPPPTIAGLDSAASAQVAMELATRLGVPASDLAVQIPVGSARSFPAQRSGTRMLGEGFTAARRLPDGGWHVVSSEVEGFPNAFQRQALMLLAAGLLLLLPLAWLFAHALAAPIRRFAEGANRLGHDPAATPLPSSGPKEMRLAVEAFNAMQTRIDRLLRERSQMLAAIAHDLRTPLTRLAFRLEDLPAPLNQKVSADIQEMKEMITATLEFIRERQNTAPRERLDLRALLDRIVDDLADLGHDVSFAAGAPVTIEGEPLALRRLFMNLVENALKYGERARLRLGVAEYFAVVEIDDDGPGVPPGRQEQIFEPFFRLENSRNRDTGGIGLGLATAKSIAVDHGGTIAVGNRSGGGLRVTVRLPLSANR